MKWKMLARTGLVVVLPLAAALAVAACAPAAPPAPTLAPVPAAATAPPAKPTEPPKPAATQPAVATAPAKPTQAPKPAPTQAAAEAPIPLRFASIANASQAYIPVVMLERGIARKYAFDLTLVDLSTTTQQWTSMRAGESDVSSGSFLDLLRQRQAGLKAKAFRGFYTFGNPIVAPVDKPYSALSDLRGAQVGVPNASLLDWMILRAAGKKINGFDIGKDAQVAEAAPPILLQMVLRGQMDASYQFSDFVLEPLVDRKIKEVTTVRKAMAEAGLDTDAFYLTFNVVESWRERYGPDALARLVAAMDEAVSVMDADDSIWPMLAKRSGVEDPKLLQPFMALQRDRFKISYGRSKLGPTQVLLDELVKTVGEEPVGVKQVDPEAFDFDAVERAKAVRR